MTPNEQDIRRAMYVENRGLAIKIACRGVYDDERGQAPQYGHSALEDAGLDLFAYDTVELYPGRYVEVSTGIALELPPGYHAHIRPRSGLALRHGVTCHQGTIDSGYRGEIIVLMTVIGDEPYTVKAGDKIAQMVIIEHTPVRKFVEVTLRELQMSDRGKGGFGSTGNGKKPDATPRVEVTSTVVSLSRPVVKALDPSKAESD